MCLSARVCQGRQKERVRESGGVAELGPPGAAMAVLAESGKGSGRLWAAVRDRGTGAEREGQRTSGGGGEGGRGTLYCVCTCISDNGMFRNQERDQMQT